MRTPESNTFIAARKPTGASTIAPKASKPASDEFARHVQQKKLRGRPSRYRPEFCDAMISYFAIEVEHIERTEVANGHGGIVVIETPVLNLFPTVTRFAASIGLCSATLRRWATAANKDGSLKFPDFSEAYLRARESQESLLLEGGLTGRYNSRFACQAAKNLMGWRSALISTDNPAINEPVKPEAIHELDAFLSEAMEQHAAAKQIGRRSQ